MNAGDVTAVILTRDEERRLPRALASLPAGIRILVLDARSSDRTAEIARAAGARVVERPWRGFVDARRYALGCVETPWTFALDADEVLDASLRAAILACDGALDAYALTRDTYFCGRALRMWRGERLVRLFKTARARVEAHPAAGGSAELHERYVTDGPAGTLDGRLAHYSYESAAAYREKFERYTDLEAAGAPRRASAGGVLLRFAHALLARGAALDGPGGLYVAWMSALYPYVAARKARARR